MRTILAITLALTATACASAPVAPLPVVIAPTFEDKMAWILRLEDQRALRDPVAVVAAQATPPPDLVRLLADPEARVRRRAALAVGRVGLAAGVGPVAALLGDADPEVRQMAAFALGLIGDKTALEPLIRALDDPSPLVEGSAAQALGLLGDRSAADALGRLAVRLVEAGAVADVPGEDTDERRDLPVSAFRLAIYALARLNAYDQLAAAVLDSSGQPKVRWWPVAYALQRVADKRALPALLTLAKDSHPYTQAFAVKGLGELKDPAAVPVLLPLLTSRAPTLTIEALGALGLIADPGAADAVLRLLRAKDTDSAVRVAATGILGSVHAQGAADMLLDSLSDSNPAVRSASLRALAALDPDQFVLVVSGLDPDPDWTVRAALASVLGALPSDASVPRLTTMLRDPDQRVVPAVLRALVKRHAPGVVEILLRHLEADDPAVRAASAAGLEETRPAGGAAALADAYRSGARDATHVVRAAVLTALAAYGVDAARPSLQAALADKDWAVRVRAAALLKQLDPSSAADVDAQIRPAPTTAPPGAYREKRLVSPPFSTAIYIDTDRGTIQLELLVLDAPLTVENFVTLARKGFFNGLSVHRVVPGFVTQTGDPRGDGAGGPGYTVRDEINEHPYLRGTVGMALDSWGDTGGSQFFVTLAPQPQLDGRYTVFARVVSGMDVVDEIQENDVIRRVRVWDGETMSRAFGSPAFGF